MNLAAVPDVVDFDYRRHGPACRTFQSTADCGGLRQLDGPPCSSVAPPCDGSSSLSDVGMDTSIAVDSETRLVQSCVTGDWRFVTSASSSSSREPVEFSTRRPRRRRYVSVLPRDMGVGSSPSDLGSGTEGDVGMSSFPPQVPGHPRQDSDQHRQLVGSLGTTVLAATSSVCQLDLSLRASGTTVLPSAGSLPGVRESASSDVVLSTSSSASSTTVTSVRCLPNIEDSDTAVSEGNAAVSVLSDADVVKNSTLEVAQSCSGDVETEEPISQSPVSNESLIQTSPSSDGSGRNSVVLHSPDTADTDRARTVDKTGRGRVGVTGGCGGGADDVVKSCAALSTQFAADADLEADLLSARLLREFREAIRSAVDSISSAGRSNPPRDNVELPGCDVLRAAPSSVSAQNCGGRAETAPTRLSGDHGTSNPDSRTDSAFRRFRLSNIPTLNGVNRCRRSVVDDLTTATHCRAPSNVFRHRRSLPDTNQLRSYSLSTSGLSYRDAVAFPPTTSVMMRSSLVIGASSSPLN